ncbi:MAG TPA: endonuclease/exonuclease/phosphatase family protein [Candidatus Hydrogenedentes bacterium]|nr:endonuclease/exonuclease/phosphatase family protein [Candidatus Hydrogenedentota bacterium]
MESEGRSMTFASILGKGLIAFVAAGWAATWFGAGIWFLEGAAYWIPCYLALALTGVAACVVASARRWALFGMVCAAAIAAMLAQCYLPAENRAPKGQTPNLRILQANVYNHFGDAGSLIALVREFQPDVVLLQEADDVWAERLRPIEAMYPRKAILPRYTRGGPDLGQYLRIESDEPRALSDKGIPAVMTTIRVNGRSVSLLNVHTAAPFLPGRAKSHRKQMRALTDFARSISGPVIVAGDLNSGPWSPLYKTLTREARLVSARQGFGILGSWPSFFCPLRTGIDHVLASPDIAVVQCRVGKGIRSDHRPLLTELFVPPPR